MRIKTPLFYIQVDITFIIFIISSIFLKAVRDIFSAYIICYLFIIFHESSHILVATILGKEVDTFYLRLCGVSVTLKKKRYTINKENKNGKKQLIKEMVIYLVGPISNMFLALIFYNVEIVYDINIFLGILNLLPIYPLDGYNIIKNVMLIYYRDNVVSKILEFSNMCVTIIMLTAGIVIFIYKCNPCLLLFFIYVVILNYPKVRGRVTF